MALLNDSPPAYTERSGALEKGLPAHESGDTDNKSTSLRAAEEEATAVLSGTQNLSETERSKEAIAILERGLGAFSSASDSDHAYNTIMVDAAIRTLRNALEQGHSSTNGDLTKAMSNAVRILMPTVVLDPQANVRYRFYGFRMRIVSSVIKWLAWEPVIYSLEFVDL
jgi:hypothetical protein